MIGDSVKDIECAHNAGCKQALLVKTGNGLSAAATLERRGMQVSYVAEDLRDAANWILNRIP
jgi:D-glycero-D-manno-heptose 1,7-bisphosphate phosphatase